MKLLTKAIERKLEKSPINSTDGMGKDAPVIVKFFYPYGSGTWLVTEGERQENGDWLFYGAAEIGYGWEWGTVMLSDMLSVQKFGKPAIERDMYSPPKTVGEVWADA